MLDFDVQPRGRRCAKTDHLFLPGEEYYSVLLAEGAKVNRYDYAAAQWEGPPENALGWWKSQVPDHRSGKVNWAPNDVMLHYFRQINDDAEKADVCYILALLLVRRRVLRLEDSETDDQGRELLVVQCPKSEETFRVPAARPDGRRTKQIQDELAELLFGSSSA